MLSMALTKLAILASPLVLASFPAPQPQNPPTAAVVDKLELYSQYAAAVYCPDNTQTTAGELLKCSSGACPRVVDNGAKYLGGFYNALPFYSTCLVAVDPTEHTIILSCRGAAGPGFVTPFLSSLKPCSSICPDCKCHTGFFDSWSTVRDRVNSLVESARQCYPGYPLIVTGHSLGAAQAFYAAAEFRNKGTAATLYTYGQPHTGDENLAQHVTGQGSNYRVTHTDDPAPRIGDTSSGYRHISPEYWIFNDESGFLVEAGDIAVIPGLNNETGNEGTGGSDVSAHTEYFQANIASCFSSG